MADAVKLDGVTVELDGSTILSNINTALPAKKVIGLLGPSGAGKTTLIRTMLGLVKPTAGSVTVLGSPAGSPQLHSKIGYVTQSPAVYADLTVAENMRYFASLVGGSKAQTQRILKDVEMDGFAQSMVGRLSGGQWARVSLAVALVGNPKLLLLDEPTVGLDPVLRQKLWRIFNLLVKKGITIVVSSHVMDEADQCQHIVFLRDGKLLVSDTNEAVLKNTGTRTMENAFLQLATGGRHESAANAQHYI